MIWVHWTLEAIGALTVISGIAIIVLPIVLGALDGAREGWREVLRLHRDAEDGE